MSTLKRLFLFAAYDNQSIIDDALVLYVSTLAKFGDIILCTDCDCAPNQIEKLKPYTVHIINGRHGEYDFGSYKRAFQYARDEKLLKNYNTVYLVNDSVFGPMFDMSDILKKSEQIQTDAVGLVVSKHKTHKFMESWFVRLDKKIFTSKWFDEFMSDVKRESDKRTITIKYEHGLTNLIHQHNCSWTGIYEFYGRFTYNRPRKLFTYGCPFIKKSSFTRHFGDCGIQIKYIFKYADTNAVKSVMKTATRLYGEKYMNKFLTDNPIKIWIRQIRYLIHKIKNGEL